MSGELVEVLAEVIGQHEIGRWSDWTYSCHGCKARYEEAVEADVTKFDRAEHNRLTKPNWSRADADLHLARAVQTHIDAAVAAARREGVNAGIEIAARHMNAVQTAVVKPWIKPSSKDAP